MREYREKQKQITCKANGKANSKSNVRRPDKNKKENKNINNTCSPEPNEYTQKSKADAENRESDFEKIYAIYPKKRGRTRVFANYCSWLKGRTVNGKRTRLSNRDIYITVRNYVGQQEESGTELEYYKNFDTLMGSQLIDYVKVETDE